MTLIKEIAVILIFERTLVVWTGILTLIAFLFTASIGLMNFKGISKIPFKWHPRMAITSFVMALIHAVLAFSLYF